jgi:hypothetical protein
MSAKRLPRCPVCHNPVTPTAKGNIAGHFDKANNPCLTSGEPYTMAMRVA